ncbi:hypothetical protein C2S52_018521 [Perilla frutescens var. hirtella]|nr:hypothetical protein C2S52_018521 [Perilla frutescens var. hirtella]
MVDNAAGGDIGGRTAEKVSNIYETMATTSQQKSARRKRASVNEVNPSYDVTRQLAELTRQYGHEANVCQKLIEPELSKEAHFHALQEQVYALQGFQPPSVKRIETQVGQIARTVRELAKQAKPGKLPSQPEQAQAITILRRGKEPEKENEEGKKPTLHKATNPYTPPIPFPSRLRNEKQDTQFQEFYKLLSKVNVNLPLLDVIRNVPAYVKFFKELASKKRKFTEDEKIMVSEVVSAILQQQLPPKLHDPGSFTLKITLGNGKEACGMLDLGAEINLMPYSIFKQLELGELKPTRMCLQLTDRSVRYPRGIIEDILVKVGGLIIPVDFVVLDVGDVQEMGKEHTLLLGGDELDAEEMEILLGEGISLMEILTSTEEEVKPSPELELKELPSYLKYVYLDEEKKKPVIIFAALEKEEEELLVALLKRNKQAIGWNLSDIKSISPTTCMHRIVLEEGAKPGQSCSVAGAKW